MTAKKLDLMQGTLDVMVLQTLSAMESLHGYGIARRIEQISACWLCCCAWQPSPGTFLHGGHRG
jgi:DNA-binding PadR family transcriptional regulator